MDFRDVQTEKPLHGTGTCAFNSSEQFRTMLIPCDAVSPAVFPLIDELIAISAGTILIFIAIRLLS